MSLRAWRLIAAVACALCLAGALVGAVAVAGGDTAKGGPAETGAARRHHPAVRHRRSAKRTCRRHLHNNKRKRCPAFARHKPVGVSLVHARGFPLGPGSSNSGAGASESPSPSGSAGTQVGGAPNPSGQTPAPEEPGASGTPDPPAHLQVSAREFSLTLSRPSAQAGRIVVELVNAGQDEHNLHIRPAAGGADVGAVGIVLPGHHSDVQFNLPPGSYTLYCAVPAHEELGMKATLTVQ